MIPIFKNACAESDTIIASFHNGRYLMAPHIHQLAELVFVLEGEFTVISPGKREIAKTGDIVLSYPYQPHGYFTEEDKNVNFWMILFDASVVNDIIRDGYSYSVYETRVFTPSDELRIFLSKRMIDTDEKIKKLNNDELRHVKATLYPVFDEYLSVVPITKESEKICSTSVAETFKYLSEHFRENITLKDVSKAIGYSESHISHSLPNVTGLNFRGVLNSMRITHAKALLMNTNANIAVVSVECGFGSERSFHRAFQATTGMTPSDYKQIYIQKSLKNN